MATATGRGIGVLYQLYHLFKGKGLIRLGIESLKADWAIIKSIASISWPATLQFIIGSCSWIFLARLVAETGHSQASAGYQTALRVIVFFILPAWGVSNAAATLVGQNLGAKQIERAEESVLKTAKYNALFMALVTLLLFFGSELIVSFFTTQPEIQSFAIQALRIISAGYIFYGIGMVMTNAFNGAGDTVTPTWINFIAFWLLQIPLCYTFAKLLNWGPVGVYWGIAISESMLAVIAIFIFRRGKWKTVQI